MPESMSALVQKLHLDLDPYFSVALALLILARTIPMVVLTPIFGGKTVTGQIKVGIAMILMMVLFPVISPLVKGNLPTQGMALWTLVLKEAAVGSMIGFLSSLVFMAIESAGHLIDIQRGTAQASVLVPQLDIQGPVFANLQIQLATVFFFTVNGHHLFLRGYFDSFRIIPVNSFPNLSGHFLTFVEQSIRMSGDVLIVAIQMTGPILLAILMVDIVMGVTNRIAPMVQVYFLAMPIKAFVGILIFLASFGYIMKYMGVLFTDMLRDLRILVNYLSLG
jgi:flagellar biosynthetic protein FliR